MSHIRNYGSWRRAALTYVTLCLNLVVGSIWGSEWHNLKVHFRNCSPRKPQILNEKPSWRTWVNLFSSSISFLFLEWRSIWVGKIKIVRSPLYRQQEKGSAQRGRMLRETAGWEPMFFPSHSWPDSLCSTTTTFTALWNQPWLNFPCKWFH